MTDWDSLMNPAREALEALIAKGDDMADRIEELEAKLAKLVDAVTHQREMVCQDFDMQIKADKAVDDALAELKGEK